MARNSFLIQTAAATAIGCLWTLCGFQPLAAQTRQVQVVDPVLQMRAYTWSIPSNWIFEGTLMNGSSCVQNPVPVFRMMSPDGIVELKQLPRLDWSWQIGGTQAAAKPDCLPLNRVMAAPEFLKYMVNVLGVTFVREEQAPNAAEFRENMNNLNARNANSPNPLRFTGDVGRFLVKYNVNSIPVEEYLSATISCSENTHRFGVNQVQMTFHNCSAWVSRQRAREGQLAGLQDTFKSIAKSFAIDQQWNQKRTEMGIAQVNEAGRQGMERIKRQGQEIAAASQARHNAFMQSQAIHQQQHEQFLATMQRGTNMSMNRTGEAMNARSRAAGDWADYALDQQKRRDPRTGEITKDSSAYSYTWVDSSGKRIQTNDVNDNPNGRVNGNWTLQQNVR